jgi:ABC-2 type transport system ATP-binding protein
MPAPAIEIESLSKTYRDGFIRGRRIEALKQVSFAVEQGSIFGLLGPNGAGKTTLIKVLLGLVKKTGGRAELLGRAAGDRASRASVGYLPENHRIPRHLTGNSALVYYGGLSGLPPSEVRRRRPELLARVGLEKWGKTSVRKYSKGMLQRLGLAQAMLHDPLLLVLDEPTDGVDPVGRAEMRKVLNELKAAGKTVFINSHLLQEVELVCDRAAILVEGSLRRVGLIEEITRRRNPQVLFLIGGAREAIAAALAKVEPAAAIDSMTPHAENLYQVFVRAGGQAALNSCIDALRGDNLDIVAVTHPRETLESAFIDIVSEGTTDKTS